MRYVQLSLLPGACLVGLWVSKSGWLAPYCDDWLQAALPTLALLAVAAQIYQLGVKSELKRLKRNSQKRPGPEQQIMSTASGGDDSLAADYVLNSYLAHRYSPGIVQAIGDFLSNLRLQIDPPYIRRDAIRAGVCVLWSFSGFVLPILTATLFIVALVSSKFVSSAQWSQFAIAWVVAATCVPPLFRVLPGKREERTWSSWQKQGLILQSQRDAILRNRELYNLGQTMFAPRDTFSWNLREKETKGSTKLETIVIDHVHRSVDFVKYDTLTACWFFPGVTMDLYVERTQRQQTAVKLTKTPLSCARAEMFREARIRNADFVLAKHSRCQLSFHKVRS